MLKLGFLRRLAVCGYLLNTGVAPLVPCLSYDSPSSSDSGDCGANNCNNCQQLIIETELGFDVEMG